MISLVIKSKHKNVSSKNTSSKKVKNGLWIVLPGHNEEKNLAPVLHKVKRYTENVIFVDDGSTDNTYDVAVSSGVTVLSHISNLGKGGALRTGCDYAISQGAEKIIVMDSDGQHDPDEIDNFLKKLNSGADIVVGCRRLNKNMPFVMKVGNYGLYKISSLLFDVDVKDTQSGYRAFTSDAYRKIRWISSDYSMESEMIARISKTKLNYASVPISTIYLDNYKGTTIINGIIITINMLFWKIFGLPDNSF